MRLSEEINTRSSNRKPELYTDENGKRRIRMVPSKKDVVSPENKVRVPVTEATDDSRLKQLAMLGLVDKSDIQRLMTVVKKMDEGKPLSMKEKDIILGMFSTLVSIITGDTTTFQKAKKAVKNG